MRAFRALAAAGVCWLTVAVGPASAAWDNVFQVCCNSCRQPRASFFAPAPVVAAAPVIAASPPTTCCQPQVVPVTSYVQRSYYQPVTSYRTSCYYEPVTSYQQSYYYEPVTSYRSSCYTDPCTGCPVQVTVPTTSYRLRSQCNAVQSYVMRQAVTPVTTYEQRSYYEAVTSYYQQPCPQPACPTCGPAAVAAVAPAAVAVPAPAAAAVPQTLPPTAVPTAPPPATSENRSFAPPPAQTQTVEPPHAMPPAAGGTAQPKSPALPPIRFSRTTSGAKTGSVQGQLVRADYITPRAGTPVRFVNLDRLGDQRAATTDAAGRFGVTLAAGRWGLYVPGADGRLVYHSKLDVRASDERSVMVVSR